MRLPLNPRRAALFLVAVGVGVAVYNISIPLRASALKSNCQTNLKFIGMATFQYARDYDEELMLLPEWKDGLWSYAKYFRDSPREVESLFSCPKTARGHAFNAGLSGVFYSRISAQDMALFYEPARPINADGGENWARSVHGNGSNVCFLDGHVAWVQSKPIFWTPELAAEQRDLAARQKQQRTSRSKR